MSDEGKQYFGFTEPHCIGIQIVLNGLERMGLETISISEGNENPQVILARPTLRMHFVVRSEWLPKMGSLQGLEEVKELVTLARKDKAICFFASDGVGSKRSELNDLIPQFKVNIRLLGKIKQKKLFLN